MPWSVKRSSDCPEDKPWAVVNDESGETEGCHADEDSAKRQQAALYANTDEGGEARAVEDMTRRPDDPPIGPRRPPDPDTDWGDHPDEQSEEFSGPPEGSVEFRSVEFTDIDTSVGGSREFEGYAAVFDVEADLGDFTESVDRGAYRKSLSEGYDIPLLYRHNPDLPWLASTKAGTLTLKEDGKGLRTKANIASHFLGDAVLENVNRGEIRGMSVGFIAGAGNSRIEHRGGKPHRSLSGFKRLLDVSPAPDPVYEATSAELRSLLRFHAGSATPDEVQEVLSGSYQQLEDAASPSDADTGEEAEETRSGVVQPTLAAARRRLQVMEATIPKEFRR